MAGEIINLRRARKQKARAEREQEAAENRRRFGQTKGEKETEAATREQAARLLEAHRRETPDG